MELLFKIIISYFALYLVILLHELGHSFFYWKFGCKENWIKVTVKPYLFFSTPALVDENKADLLKDKDDLIISYAGITVNLIVALLAVVLNYFYSSNNVYVNLFISQFISLNLVEAITYLVIGNIYLVSDMENVARINSKLRSINFVIGLAITIFYLKYLFTLQGSILSVVIISNLLVILCMGLGRIIFTYLYSK